MKLPFERGIWSLLVTLLSLLDNGIRGRYTESHRGQMYILYDRGPGMWLEPSMTRMASSYHTQYVPVKSSAKTPFSPRSENIVPCQLQWQIRHGICCGWRRSKLDVPRPGLVQVVEKNSDLVQVNSWWGSCQCGNEKRGKYAIS